MLRRLSADHGSFRTVTFRPGINLLVADTTETSRETDSRNGTGKSSLVELLHFLLGANAGKKSLTSRRPLQSITFALTLDWPGNGQVTVQRKGSDPGFVRLDPDIRHDSDSLFDVVGPAAIPTAEWNRLVEQALFGLGPDHPGISGRTMLSFLIRRIAAKAFNDAVRTFPQQSEAEATANLAYLLGLDWRLAAEFRELAARESTRRQLRKAVDDPVWGRIVGSVADLRGQIALAENEVSRLKEQIGSFRIVPAYEELKNRADDINRRIRAIPNEDITDRRNLEDLQKSVSEAADPDTTYLERAYQELGVTLGQQVRQRFDDVQASHASVIRNRRRYLTDEMNTIQQRLEARRREREQLGEELASVLKALDEGGALEALTALQQALAQKQASVDALKHRYEAAQALESSARQITAKRAELQEAMATDLDERQAQTREAILLFAEYARRLYGPEHEAYLAIQSGTNSLKITPFIDRGDSRGIGNMVIFCLDLTVAVIARRHGRGPDFLVHDSHLFDGVDDRQIAAALTLAAEVAEEEDMQYIVSLNSDDLSKAVQRGFSVKDRVIDPRLTDASEEGGLFGFRF
ncbi:ABC-three component system protein [Streptomyces blattellae]|uniref:ABC-three component system protein n=1 Tax=Streptomyces blattellae TaxID=2569855 RepID=UPI0012B997F4|nr:ABC-three component system protein [Streptomyces blattellae]